MANMSYCRFENTASDLQDCERHLLDGNLSRSERGSREELVRLCYTILETVGCEIETDIEEVVENIKELEQTEEEDE